MTTSRSYRLAGLMAVAVGATGSLFFVLPVVGAMLWGNSAVSSLQGLADWKEPALRSAIAMLLFAPGCALAGFACGAFLADQRAPAVRWSGVLLVPLLVGGGVGSFVFKLYFTDVAWAASAIQDRSAWAFWLVEGAMLAWQFVPGFTFFSWQACRQTPANRLEFAEIHRMTFFERLADIYWPQCRALTFYLFLLVAFASASEFERAALVFRASPGTGTDFISHWLVRSYFLLARVDPKQALTATMFYSGLFLVAFSFACTALALFGNAVLPRLLRFCARVLPGPKASPPLNSLVLLGVFGAVLLPLGPTILRGVGTLAWFRIGDGLLQVAPAVLIVGASCASFAFFARMAWPEALESLSPKAISACLALSCAGFLPPVGLAFSGMWWLSHLETTTIGVVPLWWGLLAVSCLPLFVPGFLAIQFGVGTAELRFQRQNRATAGEIFQVSFLRRLWPAMLLFLIFIYAVAWSEYPLSSLFAGLSPSIRSPMLELALRVEGKGAEFNEAAGIVLQILLPSFICAVAFGFWANRRQRPAQS